MEGEDSPDLVVREHAPEGRHVALVAGHDRRHALLGDAEQHRVRDDARCGPRRRAAAPASARWAGGPASSADLRARRRGRRRSARRRAAPGPRSGPRCRDRLAQKATMREAGDPATARRQQLRATRSSHRPRLRHGPEPRARSRSGPGRRWPGSRLARRREQAVGIGRIARRGGAGRRRRSRRRRSRTPPAARPTHEAAPVDERVERSVRRHLDKRDRRPVDERLPRPAGVPAGEQPGLGGGVERVRVDGPRRRGRSAAPGAGAAAPPGRLPPSRLSWSPP